MSRDEDPRPAISAFRRLVWHYCEPFTNVAGQALAELSAPGNALADAVAEIIQRIRPEVLLMNEFDFEPDNALAEAFQDNYLDVAHSVGGEATTPIDYPYVRRTVEHRDPVRLRPQQ